MSKRFIKYLARYFSPDWNSSGLPTNLDIEKDLRTSISHEDIQKVSVNFATLIQTLWAISIKAAAAAHKSDKDARGVPGALDNTTPKTRNIGNKILGGTIATIPSVYLKKIMEGKEFNSWQVTFITTVVEQLCKMPLEMKEQQTRIYDKLGKSISLAKTFKPHAATAGLYGARSAFLWFPTNNNELAWWQKATQAAALNLSSAPVVSAASKFALNYHSEAQENIKKAYRLSVEQLGWKDVYEGSKNMTFRKFYQEINAGIDEAVEEFLNPDNTSSKKANPQRFYQKLNVARRGTFAGVGWTSAAAAAAAVIFSKEVGDELAQSLQEAWMAFKENHLEEKVADPSSRVKPTDGQKTTSDSSKSRE